jgi:hypothetical protein
MTLDEALQIADSYQGMLEVACILEEKAAGLPPTPLSHAEAVIRHVARVDREVCNGGWDQWMFNTPVHALAEAVPALLEVGAVRVAAMAKEALAAVGVLPELDSEEAKHEKLRRLTGSARQALHQLDDAFYEFTEDHMGLCKDYVLAHRGDFA